MRLLAICPQSLVALSPTGTLYRATRASFLPTQLVVVRIPLEDGRRLYELTAILTSGTSSGDSAIEQATVPMFQYGSELAARKRANPGDDIATSLLQAEVDGQSLTDLEFNLFFILLINAGGDTTRNLVARAFWP